MIFENTDGLRILRPESGKLLTNGDVYSDAVYLAVNAAESDWWEVDDTEVTELSSDTCVSCGAPVPEGRMVCWQCEHPEEETE